jgi:hypothetical protein
LGSRPEHAPYLFWRKNRGRCLKCLALEIWGEKFVL